MAAAVVTALLTVAIRRAHTRTIHTRIRRIARATTSAATIVTAGFAVAIGLTNTLIINAQGLRIACATIATASIITTLLVDAGRKDRRIKRRTIHVIHNPVVVIVVVQTIRKTGSIRVWEVFVNHAVAVIVYVVADFLRQLIRVVAKKLSRNTNVLSFLTKVRILPIAGLIEIRLVLTVHGRRIAVVVLAVTKLGIHGVGVIAHHH